MTLDDAERDPLLSRLRAQRRHIVDQLDGLDDAPPRQPVLADYCAAAVFADTLIETATTTAASSTPSAN